MYIMSPQETSARSVYTVAIRTNNISCCLKLVIIPELFCCTFFSIMASNLTFLLCFMDAELHNIHFHWQLDPSLWRIYFYQSPPAYMYPEYINVLTPSVPRHGSSGIFSFSLCKTTQYLKRPLT